MDILMGPGVKLTGSYKYILYQIPSLSQVEFWLPVHGDNPA